MEDLKNFAIYMFIVLLLTIAFLFSIHYITINDKNKTPNPLVEDLANYILDVNQINHDWKIY